MRWKSAGPYMRRTCLEREVAGDGLSVPPCTGRGRKAGLRWSRRFASCARNVLSWPPEAALNNPSINYRGGVREYYAVWCVWAEKDKRPLVSRRGSAWLRDVSPKNGRRLSAVDHIRSRHAHAPLTEHARSLLCDYRSKIAWSTNVTSIR